MIKSGQVTGGSAPTDPISSLCTRGCLGRWACAYGVAIVYVSVALGPDGVNFVPRDPLVAWRLLLATPYLATGSDQRPDWMANLVMLIPLGFLTAGALQPDRQSIRQAAAGAAALLVCMLFVVAVKYAQLFFPPRTVSLNYILAQGLGSLIGVLAFHLSRARLAALRQDLVLGGDHLPIALCGLYVAGYLFFLLFPFDFAFSGEDLRQRAATLPRSLLSWPGAGVPARERVMLPLAYAAATVPFGVLLAVARRSLSVARIALAGFLMISAATTMSMLLLDSTPSLAGLACRTGGIAIGGALARRLAAADAGRWRPRLARLVPWLTAPYLIAVLYAKNLLSSHWRTLPEALAAFDSHGLLPFYHHYIVTKAHAARSVAFELICFGPIGVMAALRRGGGRGTLWLAASLAFLLSFAIEFARWFKPGLQPDFSNPIIAAIGAALAAALTPIFWQALTAKPIEATGVGAPEGSGDSSGARTWQLFSEVFVRDRRQSYPFPFRAVLALAVSLGCLAAAGMIAAAYPLAPWLIGSVLALYAAALWRWPSLWLAVLPAMLPAFDLAPWTGWVYVGEADLFALVTIGILALRAPPRAADFRFRGLAVAALMLAVLSCLAGMALGLAMPGPAGGSDNPYLRPDNALRVAKGFLTALALLPFLRERLRRSSDALSWLGAGITTGLAVVAVAAIAERSLFPGLIDFSAEYRISATFSSMGFGGGYVGAYIALALPFLLVCLVRPRLPTLIAMALVALGAGYALIVTFARAAYAASLLSVVVACLGWGWAARRGRAPPLPSLTLPALFLAMVGVIVAAGIATPAMSRRVEQTSVDLAGRETSWTQGLALRDRGLLAALYGMGLGTYPRVVLAHKLDGRFPTNFVVGRDGGYGFLSLFAGMPLYFGQIVPIEPGRTYRLFLGLRSPAGKGALSVLLCEKWLMYSDNCRRLTVVPRTTGQWEDFGAVIASKELGRPALFGWLRRPVDISLFDPVPGTAIDIGHVRMLDARGHDLLANGDFSRGTERWYFTDDDHLMWRIENQYLMTLIETGVLGLAALILLAAAAMLGAIRGIRFGVPMAACIAGSLAGFLFCCLFDCLLDAPRLATLFYLIAFSGLAMLSHAPSREPSVGSG